MDESSSSLFGSFLTRHQKVDRRTFLPSSCEGERVIYFRFIVRFKHRFSLRSNMFKRCSGPPRSLSVSIAKQKHRKRYCRPEAAIGSPLFCRSSSPDLDFKWNLNNSKFRSREPLNGSFGLLRITLLHALESRIALFEIQFFKIKQGERRRGSFSMFTTPCENAQANALVSIVQQFSH